MWNYTKETIINDVANTVLNDNGTIVVKRGGNYDVKKISNAKIYKTAGSTGKKATAVITPTLDLTGYDVARFTIYLSTPGAEFVEFGSPNWQEFGKPIIVETAATTIAGIVEAFKLALPNDNKLFEITSDASTITLTAAETWMDFAEVNYTLVKFVDFATSNTETVTDKSASVVLTHGKPEFATAKWIVENLRFPSHPNLRYTPLYADEAPVAGKVYDEYSFEYRIERSVLGGMSAVGQVVDSAVRIVFYVAHDLASDFETALNAAGTSAGVTLDINDSEYKA